jgi:hypothetical protein
VGAGVVPDVTEVSVHLRAAGALLLVLAAGDLVLPLLLTWPDDPEDTSLLARQLADLHSYYVGLMYGLMGAAAVILADDLAKSDPAERTTTALLIGAMVVWGVRLVVEVGVIDPVLWKGRTRNVVGHYALVVAWSYLFVVFGWALFRQI